MQAACSLRSKEKCWC